MLAQRLPGLLPPLTHSEALEVAAVAAVSAAGFTPECLGQRPFRAPHHTASAAALVGGVGGGGGGGPGGAARERYRGRIAGRTANPVPGGVSAHRRNEPLSVRAPRGSIGRLPLHAGRGATLSGPHFRSVARPAGHARGGGAG